MKQPWFSPVHALDEAVNAAFTQIEGELADFDAQVRPADPRFGDFQANGALPYAKKNRTNPRQLGEKLAAALEAADDAPAPWVDISVAGPGFINFQLTPQFLHDWLTTYRGEASLREAATALFDGRKVVVDYPSPNTAKQMHVGHLRPMVIGEAISRLVAFCGADVVRDNHLGDWGTNFGTLIMAIKRAGDDLAGPEAEVLDRLEALYREGTDLEKQDPSVREQSREELVRLQQGDPVNLALWKRIVAVSDRACREIYELLGVQNDLTLGESFYRDRVDRIYRELTDAGLAEESQGALVVFHPEHPRFKEQPFIIRKRDGASNYATHDLATILYRVEELGAEQAIYVTDGRQQDHFQQLFLTAEKWFERTGRRLPRLDHVWFGTILGEDGKAIKTKSGEPIRLKSLLAEAVQRVEAIVAQKNPELSAEERAKVAQVVGLGAVKYADLMQNRTGDYVFSWDRMLALDGNTAPYLLYAVARIHSIFRRAGLRPGDGEEEASVFATDTEIALARKLVGFVATVEQTLVELRPHYLCTYLYELAGTFSTFYNADRVIVDEPDVRARRLMLCARTLGTLETGLHLLGLETLERM